MRYALLDGGRVAAIRFKVDLPNYGVFDEKRVFAPGPVAGPLKFRGVRIGVPICEDTWSRIRVRERRRVPGGNRRGNSPRAQRLALCEQGKSDVRLSISVARVTESDLPLVYLNQVGGQDELVFDGASFVLNADRSLAAQLPAFAKASSRCNGRGPRHGWRCNGPVAPQIDGDKADYAACVLGLRDYVQKNGFPGVVLGAVRRHRLGLMRGHRRRCARGGARPRRHAAVPLYRRRSRSTMRRRSQRRLAFATRCCRSRRR